MKTILYALTILTFSLHSSAQQLNNPVAHWTMDSTTADISGNGHHGTGSNITPTSGATGIPNTAYKFNGVNSLITVPSSTDFDFSKFSLCVTLRVDGYNPGYCGGNYVIARGEEDLYNGNWSIRFDDNAYNGCGVLDTNLMVFISTAGQNTPSSNTAQWQYSPNIVSAKWYKLVITFDSLSWKIYANNSVLLNTVLSTGNPIGVGTQDIAIGMNMWNSTYPFPFNGVIDDIQIFNRVLDTEEIGIYTNVCGGITYQPVDTMTAVNGTVSFKVNTTMLSPEYQWQVKVGNGFIDLTNNVNHSGVKTHTLIVSNITASMGNSEYRCVIKNVDSCQDISNIAKILLPTTVQNIQDVSKLKYYPNPAKDQLTVILPDKAQKATLEILDVTGKSISIQKPQTDKTVIDIKDLSSGIYLLKAEIDFGGYKHTVFKKIIKE